jgi:hypothetical protein
MENFMRFSAEDERLILAWIFGFVLLVIMFVVLMRSLPERIGCISQVGLFIIFLLIGAITTPYFYLVLPLYLVAQAVALVKPRE